jgi:hypothetical protein
MRRGEYRGVEWPTNEAAADKACQQMNLDDVDWQSSLEQCHAGKDMPEE